MTGTPTARLFVAVWPAPAVLSALEAVERRPVDRVRWTTPDQWHVTLRFLGSVEVEPALDALDRIPAAGPVSAVLGLDGTRLGREVLALAVDGLEELASAVAGAFDGIGRPPDRRPFRGHITLARGRGLGALPPVHLPAALTWPVTAVALVRSQLASTGARYETIGRRVLEGSVPPEIRERRTHDDVKSSRWRG